MKKVLFMLTIMLWSAAGYCAPDGMDGIAKIDLDSPATDPAWMMVSISPGLPDTAPVINLPNLPEPAGSDTSVQATPAGGLQVKGTLDGDRFLIRQDFNSSKAAPLAVDYVSNKIPATTVGWLVSNQPDKTETVMNMGWRIGGTQQILLSAADLRGVVDGEADSHSAPIANQYTSGLNYRYFIDHPWLSGVELSGYTSESQTLAVDGQQRYAGANLVGMQMGLEAIPLQNAKLKIGIGGERLSYDSQSGLDPVQNLNTSVKWTQILDPTVRYHAMLEDRAGERSVSTGLDFNLRNGQQLGFKVAHTQSADTQTTDNAVQLSYTIQFGKKFTPFQPKADNTPWNSSLVPEVLQRPGYLPKSVLTKSDSGVY